MLTRLTTPARTLVRSVAAPSITSCTSSSSSSSSLNRFTHCHRSFASAAASPTTPSSSSSSTKVSPEIRAAFARKLAEHRSNAAADLADYHRSQRRNAALGIALALFVGGIWLYSVKMVTEAKDTFTSPEVQQIQQELEREEKLEQMKKN